MNHTIPIITRDIVLLIHHALHWGKDEVIIEGKSYPFESPAHANFKFIDINGVRFQKQNSAKASKWGKMAREGHMITWGIRPGAWIRVVDGTIEVF